MSKHLCMHFLTSDLPVRERERESERERERESDRESRCIIKIYICVNIK